MGLYSVILEALGTFGMSEMAVELTGLSIFPLVKKSDIARETLPNNGPC